MLRNALDSYQRARTELQDRAEDAGQRALGAEQQAREAEQRASEAEQRALGADQRASEAGQRALAAEQRASEADRRYIAAAEAHLLNLAAADENLRHERFAHEASKRAFEEEMNAHARTLREKEELSKERNALGQADAALRGQLDQATATIGALRARQNSWGGILRLARRKFRGKSN